MTKELLQIHWQSIIDPIEVLENEEMWASRVIDESIQKSPDSVSDVVIDFTHQNQSGKS